MSMYVEDLNFESAATDQNVHDELTISVKKLIFQKKAKDRGLAAFTF